MGMDIQNNAMPINDTTWMTNINCLVDTNDKKKNDQKRQKSELHLLLDKWYL